MIRIGSESSGSDDSAVVTRINFTQSQSAVLIGRLTGSPSLGNVTGFKLPVRPSRAAAWMADHMIISSKAVTRGPPAAPDGGTSLQPGRSCPTVTGTGHGHCDAGPRARAYSAAAQLPVMVLSRTRLRVGVARGSG